MHKAFSVGDLTVTPLILGEIAESPRDWFVEAPASVPAGEARLPVNCLHVSGPGISVLIDACDPAVYPIFGTGSTTLHSVLEASGISREAITHVILTHGHHDHFCGVWDDKRNAPKFPNARHILSGREWRGDTLTKAAQLADGAAADPRPLEALHRMGLPDLENSTAALPPGVILLDAPGETLGHRVVRLTSRGQSFFFLADLFHLPSELAQFELCPTWADKVTLIDSRATIAGFIRQSRGHFMCSHVNEIYSVYDLSDY